MVLLIRKFKRKFCLKIAGVLFCCGLVAYIGSAIHRVPESRVVWDPGHFHNISDGSCGVACPYGQASFYVKTGVDNKRGPTVCFQNKVLISNGKPESNRGLSVAVINDKTLDVVTVNVYDTYITDREFVRDMKTNLKEGNLIIVASCDEISENLKDEGRRWLKLFGSEYVDLVSFRDSFLMIGQKGLKQGHAIEFFNQKGSQQFATPLERIGCFSIPLGPVLSIEEALPSLESARKVPTGELLDNCGRKEACADGHFPIMIYTGKESSEYPEVCVNGQMIMKKDLNDAGRGMNFVIVNPSTGKVKDVSRFDTYERDSRNLEMFLENLAHGDIIAAVSFDDSSRKLGFHAREILNQLGSSMVQNIKFRDVWYFIGQKGINGFTNMEMISYAGMENEWPKPLKESYCVASKIKGSPIIPDNPVFRNDARRAFCKKYDGYRDFCDSSHVDDRFIKPVLLVDESQQKNPVYSSPIIIIPGFNNNAMVRTLETTAMQPGVDFKNVIVTWDEKFPEHGELADMFGFRNLSIDSSTSYNDQMVKSIEKSMLYFTNSPFMIVLEEELLLSPDFLYFMSQCVEVLEKDTNLYGVSAFNYNGYENLSNNKSLVYRVQEFPGLAFMIKSSVYHKFIKNRMKACCQNRAWDSWYIPTADESVSAEMLVPDVSRAYRQPYEGSKSDEEYLVNLFNQPRGTNLDRNAKLFGLNHRTSYGYSTEVASLLLSSFPLNHKALTACIPTNGTNPIKLQTRGYFSVYYKQRNATDYTVLIKLCRCFGLFTMDKYSPKNLYKGILRFTYLDSNIILVGSQSHFIKYKPQSVDLFDA